MNPKKFAFIICTNSELYMNECRYYINMLVVPAGFETEIIEIRDASGMTSGYNTGMQQSDARYKIYMHQDTFLTDRSILFELLEIFMDTSIGMVGLIGGDLYDDADIHHYWNRGHVLNATYDELIDIDMRLQETDQCCIPVQAVDGLFIATQYDIEWDERIYKWHMYDISQSIRFKESGYTVCVVNTEKTWAIHDAGFCSESGYDESRINLINCYPGYFKYAPIERELLTDDLDSAYIRNIISETALTEAQRTGSTLIPEDINSFYPLYSQTKFYIYRMVSGMPENDWHGLINMILTKKISTSFLMILLNRCTLDPEAAAILIENALA